jgi:hypothetical protein
MEDGFVINVASVVAGAVTNPLGDGFYQSYRGAPRAGSRVGVYGKGAYDGRLHVDEESYDAHGRKFLLPALFDPDRYVYVLDAAVT